MRQQFAAAILVFLLLILSHQVLEADSAPTEKTCPYCSGQVAYPYPYPDRVRDPAPSVDSHCKSGEAYYYRGRPCFLKRIGNCIRNWRARRRARWGCHY